MNHRLLSLLCLGLFIGLTPLRADETRDMIVQAFVLTRQASEPAHRAEQAELLTQALEIAKHIPDHHLRGHRAAAAEEMRLALDFLHDGKPESEVKASIEHALAELRVCAGFVQAALPGLPPPDHAAGETPATQP